MMAVRHILATVHGAPSDLIDAMRAAREYRNVSYKALDDENSGFTTGYFERVLSPRGEHSLTPAVFQVLCDILCVKFEMVRDLEKEAKRKAGWTARDFKNVRADSGRPSKVLVERAKPLVLKEMSQIGNAARSSMLPAKHRTEIASKAADARWKKRGRKKTRKARRKRAWYRRTMVERLEARADQAPIGTAAPIHPQP